MGSPKALLEFHGETFLDRLIGVYSQFCEPVVVVVGCEDDRIRSGLKRPERAIFAVNEDYQLGQLSSMQCGLRMMPKTIEGVLFTLVDHPNVRPSTISALLAPPRPRLAIPQWEGRHGHPIYFDAELAAEFLALPPDSRAKVVVARHFEETRWVDVDDPGIVDDVDDPAAYRRLIGTT